MRKFFVGLFSCLVMVLGVPVLAHADVNDFTVTNFAADYTLTNDDHQGQLRIKERIEVSFTDNNHGILRAIPNKYNSHRLQLKINSVSSPHAPAQYSTYQSGGHTVLKIGDPNRTVTGAQVYDLDYTVRNVIGFYEDYDELYWNINGTQWLQPFEKIHLTVHLPAGLKLDSHTPTCYTGTFGSGEHACTITYDQKRHVLVADARRTLTAGENLSIVAGFAKGYFQPPTWRDIVSDHTMILVKFMVPFLLVAGVAWRHWFRYGRDAKGRGTIVPEYDAPDGLKPIEVGTIADFKTDNVDITATIIDLAIRGYIRIIETKNVRRFRKDTTTYSLRLLNNHFSGLKDFERSLVSSIFVSGLNGEEVSLDTLKYKLATDATVLRKQLHDSLVSRGYFRKTPFTTSVKFGLTLLGAFVVSFIFAIPAGGAAVLGLVLGSLLAVLFLILMPARTPQGVAAKESIMGLKLYLQVAESERIKKLQSPDAPYAEKSTEPKKTVDLFEKLLPFAMVLGVEQQWAKKFEGIYQTPPDWYQGTHSGFSAMYLASALNTGVGSSIDTAFSTPASSGGSGFSGGGSGGGGGGGGGGGW